MKLWREEEKVMTLYETIKGRTGIPNAHIPMWMQSYCEGKNRKSRPFIELKREEQKAIIHCETVKGRTEWREEQKAITLCGIGKGRTEKPWPYIKPMSLYEIEKGRTAEQKNRNTETQYPIWSMNLWREEQKPETHVPIYPCESTETMKGRTETHDPILLMILWKGRTETQYPCTHIPM